MTSLGYPIGFLSHQPPKIPGWNHPKTIIQIHIWLVNVFQVEPWDQVKEPNLT